ncbi:MAG: HAD family hydrolase [Paludibaculum sp.]
MNPASRAGAHRFVAFDRDGTLIAEKNYLSDPDQIELLPGARQAVDRLRAAGYGLIVITNQSGVGRGYFGMDEVRAMNQRLEELLGSFDGIYVCPHAPADQCDCRKPKPTLLLRAAAEHGFDPAESVVIGDKDVDVSLGQNAGGRGILVTTGYGAKHLAEGRTKPDFTAETLEQAVDWILSRKQCERENER